MAIYEYYCPSCRTKFEQRRPMSQATEAATCAKGHRADRTISAFAFSTGGGDVALAEAPAMGGGCGCGGACACGGF
jgi:putative FmdB family regulatory protein